MWWRDETRFPHLKAVARRYLTPLASTSLVEGMFSPAKFWCRAERSLIGHKTLDVLATLDMIFKLSQEDVPGSEPLCEARFAAVVNRPLRLVQQVRTLVLSCGCGSVCVRVHRTHDLVFLCARVCGSVSRPAPA